MKRRDVIKLGTVAAGAGIGVPGCALPRLLGSLTGADGAAAFNAVLDEQLGALAKPGLLHKLVENHTKKKLSSEARAKIAGQDEMFRRMVGTLLISQGFRELPEETQRESSVQARMWRHYEDIGSTVFEISDMLAELDPDQRKEVRKRLQERPDMPMDLGEALDERAARVGMSGKRRLQLRSMMSQASFRMQHGDPSSIIDEYVGKVTRLRESSERDASALDVSKQVGDREFWQHQHRLADDPSQAPGNVPATAARQPTGTGAPGPSVPAPLQGPPPSVPMAGLLTDSARTAAREGSCESVAFYGRRVRELDPAYFEAVFVRDPVIANCKQRVLPAHRMSAEPEEKKSHPGEGGLRAGGYMLGIGLITGLVSVLFVAFEPLVVPGLIGLTVAVLLFGIGLIVLFISALVYALSD
jgi:hypothetical protein